MEDDAIKENTISLPETIFILLLVGMEELVEIAILVLTAGAGIIVTEIMNGAVAALIEMYMLLRGGRGIMKLVVQPIGAAIDAATGGLAPGKFIATGAGIWIINHPEKVEKLMGVIGKIGGKVVQAAAIAAGGAAGAVAIRAVGTKAVEGVAAKTVEAGASAARQRMTMATRGTRSLRQGLQMRSNEPEHIPDVREAA